MAFSFATTYALGQVARRYYAGGRQMSTELLRTTFQETLGPAKQMQQEYLPQIEQSYRKFADQLSGVMRAKITSASKLTKARSEAIQKGLEKQTGKQVVLNVQVDKSLIGGLQAEMGGKLFDGSVKTQLKRIAETLAKG
jgi:F0F1-type ATP synthase delta subunit